jgi:hypothetical protein
MLTMRHHTSNDYALLPDIDDSDAGTITAADQACLDEIGNGLLRTRAHERFGVTLLHSHFPIENGETLVEEVHTDSDLLTLRPVRTNGSELVATNICFDDARSRFEDPRLIGLEYTCAHVLAGAVPINNSDRDTLSLVHDVLRSYGMTNRFGIRLLHDPLKLKGDILLETCDPIRRTLTCRRSREDDPALARSIPTVFTWEEISATDRDGLVIGQGCIQLCTTKHRCEVSSRGSHKHSSSHEPSGHQSF